MKIRHLYLVIAIAGFTVPILPFINFLIKNGPDTRLFIEMMFENEISTFFSLDVIVSTFAVIILVYSEGKRKHMKHLWVYVLMNLLVGISLALPAFLYMREKKRLYKI